MASLSVVEPLDEVKDIRFCFVPREILSSLDAFAFQCREEALHHSVVVATAFVTDAAGNAVSLKQ